MSGRGVGRGAWTTRGPAAIATCCDGVARAISGGTAGRGLSGGGWVLGKAGSTGLGSAAVAGGPRGAPLWA